MDDHHFGYKTKIPENNNTGDCKSPVWMNDMIVEAHSFVHRRSNAE